MLSINDNFAVLWNLLSSCFLCVPVFETNSATASPACSVLPRSLELDLLIVLPPSHKGVACFKIFVLQNSFNFKIETLYVIFERKHLEFLKGEKKRERERDGTLGTPPQWHRPQKAEIRDSCLPENTWRNTPVMSAPERQKQVCKANKVTKLNFVLREQTSSNDNRNKTISFKKHTCYSALRSF